MFPNVRLMIAAVMVSVVTLSCGFGMFAAFRVNHEPLSRLASGAAPLQLTADNTPAPGQPFRVRFDLLQAQIASTAVSVPPPKPAHDDAATPASPVVSPVAVVEPQTIGAIAAQQPAPVTQAPVDAPEAKPDEVAMTRSALPATTASEPPPAITETASAPPSSPPEQAAPQQAASSDQAAPDAPAPAQPTVTASQAAPVEPIAPLQTANNEQAAPEEPLVPAPQAAPAEQPAPVEQAAKEETKPETRAAEAEPPARTARRIVSRKRVVVRAPHARLARARALAPASTAALQPNPQSAFPAPGLPSGGVGGPFVPVPRTARHRGAATATPASPQ